MKIFKTISVIALIFIGSWVLLLKVFFGDLSDVALGWAAVGVFTTMIGGAAILSLFLFVPFFVKEYNNKNLSPKEQKKNKIIFFLVFWFILLILINIK